MFSHEAGQRCQNAYLWAPSTHHLTRVMLGEGRQSSLSVSGLSCMQAFPTSQFIQTRGVGGSKVGYAMSLVSSYGTVCLSINLLTR